MVTTDSAYAASVVPGDRGSPAPWYKRGVKFWVGLAIGLSLGAGAMYLIDHRPWRSAPAAAPVEVATATPPVDAGVAPTARKKRGKRTATTSSAAGAVEREVDDDVTLTAADQKVEWRGDAVSAPTRTIDLGSDDSGRPLDDDEIASGIASGSRAVVDCIKDAAGAAPLSGEVTLKMLVGASGKVDKVRVRAAVFLHEHGLTACARRAAKGFAFAATGAPTVVTAPFYLN